MGSEGTDSHVASLLGMTGTKDEGAARRVVVPYGRRTGDEGRGAEGAEGSWRGTGRKIFLKVGKICLAFRVKILYSIWVFVKALLWYEGARK